MKYKIAPNGGLWNVAACPPAAAERSDRIVVTVKDRIAAAIAAGALNAMYESGVSRTFLDEAQIGAAANMVTAVLGCRFEDLVWRGIHTEMPLAYQAGQDWADQADQPGAAQPAADYEITYLERWKHLVENPDGTFNRDAVMRELHDYLQMMDGVGTAYDEITGGQFSKPSTPAEHIIAAVNGRIAAAREAGKHAERMGIPGVPSAAPGAGQASDRDPLIPPLRLIAVVARLIGSAARHTWHSIRALPDEVKFWTGWLINPDVRAFERLNSAGLEMQHQLSGARRARRRAELCACLAVIATRVANLARYGWKEDDIAAIRLEAALMSAAAQSEWALVYGSAQPIDPKLPGIELWIDLQTETDRDRRAGIYRQLAEITEEAVPGSPGEWASQVLLYMALTEQPSETAGTAA